MGGAVRMRKPAGGSAEGGSGRAPGSTAHVSVQIHCACVNLPARTALMRRRCLQYRVGVTRGRRPRRLAAVPSSGAGDTRYRSAVESWQHCSTVGHTAPARDLCLKHGRNFPLACVEPLTHRLLRDGVGRGRPGQAAGGAGRPHSPAWRRAWRRPLAAPAPRAGSRYPVSRRCRPRRQNTALVQTAAKPPVSEWVRL